MMRYFLWILIVLVVVGGGMYFYNTSAQVSAPGNIWGECVWVGEDTSNIDCLGYDADGNDLCTGSGTQSGGDGLKGCCTGGAPPAGTCQNALYIDIDCDCILDGAEDYIEVVGTESPICGTGSEVLYSAGDGTADCDSPYFLWDDTSHYLVADRATVGSSSAPSADADLMILDALNEQMTICYAPGSCCDFIVDSGASMELTCPDGTGTVTVNDDMTVTGDLDVQGSLTGATGACDATGDGNVEYSDDAGGFDCRSTFRYDDSGAGILQVPMVLVGTTGAPGSTSDFEIVDTSGVQMRLTHTQNTNYCDYVVSSSGTLGVDCSGNVQTLADAVTVMGALTLSNASYLSCDANNEKLETDGTGLVSCGTAYDGQVCSTDGNIAYWDAGTSSLICEDQFHYDDGGNFITLEDFGGTGEELIISMSSATTGLISYNGTDGAGDKLVHKSYQELWLEACCNGGHCFASKGSSCAAGDADLRVHGDFNIYGSIDQQAGWGDSTFGGEIIASKTPQSMTTYGNISITPPGCLTGTPCSTAASAATTDAFDMDTSVARTTGDLLALSDNGTEQLAIDKDGALLTEGSSGTHNIYRHNNASYTNDIVKLYLNEASGLFEVYALGGTTFDNDKTGAEAYQFTVGDTSLKNASLTVNGAFQATSSSAAGTQRAGTYQGFLLHQIATAGGDFQQFADGVGSSAYIGKITSDGTDVCYEWWDGGAPAAQSAALCDTGADQVTLEDADMNLETGFDYNVNGAEIESYWSLPFYIQSNEANVDQELLGGFNVVTTGAAINSGASVTLTDFGITKVYVVLNTCSDSDGSITVTGTSVNRDTAAETTSDTDTLTISGLTTDSSSTDSNGNTVHDITDGYITSKWFRGDDGETDIVLSTSDVNCSDIDVYGVSFYQFNDRDGITVEEFNMMTFFTVTAAYVDSYLYSVKPTTGDKCDVNNEAELHVTAADSSANELYRLRKGNLGVSIDGSSEGVFIDWHPISTATRIINTTIFLSGTAEITP